ncbi:Uncharacterized protein OS=Isosphaera pallida (strain ATCC 43644 / DSM 9630 / IS1B) GN=Isop_2424 PE=4 SV=1 [Gemmata massiliana]|uniref:Uncharacterized protein n=1 Tax=Gemmata massiliana TaxID=1210884 RepID=A0A6P2CV08_9BACT|nr:hypothetical protein [Gemmata massiliana]VTR92821.1 Uncharacterized protein OS=Isosphaera pallida (strain ATCC 43644 / DSM 9630 / IS1B) GN=Isop_2424 PE=4 SV=1 [Gemmata massiliana]
MIYAYEEPNSRDLNYGANGGGQTLRFSVITTAHETEAVIFAYVLAGTFPYFNGFIRNEIKLAPNGADHMWKAEVVYATTGVGGGDQPLGGEASDGGPPEPPEAPASDTTPLASGYSFSIRAPKKTLLYSLQTMGSWKRGGGVAPDFKRAIGQDSDGKITGVEWPPEPSAVIKRTVARATVTQGYLATLFNLAGRTNIAPFYGWDHEDVLFLGAEGTYTQGDGWSITYEFGVQEHEELIEIVPGELPYPPETISKRGWNYLWVLFKEVRDTATDSAVAVPSAAYVEKVIRPVDFSLLGIGA